MADLSAEPSMEEILSSIKRIIAEEGEQPPRRGARPPVRPTPALPIMPAAEEDEEVLELSEPLPAPRVEPRAAEPVRAPETARPPEAPKPAEAPKPDAIVSSQAAAASRGALENLSRLLVKPEPDSDGTLEGLVREMLRPMLRDWLDANLPALVEGMVAKEIQRITSAG